MSQPKYTKGARSSPGGTDGICHIIIILLDLQEITLTGHLSYSFCDPVPLEVHQLQAAGHNALRWGR